MKEVSRRGPNSYGKSKLSQGDHFQAQISGTKQPREVWQESSFRVEQELMQSAETERAGSTVRTEKQPGRLKQGECPQMVSKEKKSTRWLWKVPGVWERYLPGCQLYFQYRTQKLILGFHNYFLNECIECYSHSSEGFQL